ncbi:MAG: sulfurtransferase [Spirochaetota bacterium]
MVSDEVITVEELRHLAGTDRIRLFDAREPEAYDEGHIPGAVNLPPSHLEQTVVLDDGDEIPHQLRPVEDLAPYFRAAGVSSDTPACVYDDGGGYLAARLWWALDVAGHPRPKLLDGGYLSWTTNVGIVSTENPPLLRGTFVPAPAEGKRLEFTDVITSIGNPRVVLCNSLSVSAFLEETLPCSVSFPYTETYAHDHFPLLRSRHELASEFASRGVTHRHHLICFCRIGYSACQLYFAARYAGFPQVSLYDGSMVEWVARGGELVPGSL